MAKGIENLRGKRVLLTGASRGIGVYIARALAREGADLVLAARDESRLETVARECEMSGSEVRVVAADVSSNDDRQRLIDEAGDIAVLVNNAGIERPLRFTDLSDTDVAEQIATNLLAPIELCRLALRGMLARGSGVLVNVSSMSGKSPTPFNAVYSATKYGLNGFTAAIEMELKGTGVHAGVVCPSFVAEAGMWANSGETAPRMLPEVPPEKVVDAVLAVIHGANEVLVTPGPMRPFLALAQLLPGLEDRVLRTMGVFRAFEARARRNSPSY